jgi:hypothetical protein
MMRCTVIFRKRVATFSLKKMSFMEEMQPGILFRTILDVICTKYLPDLEQLLMGRFYVITEL